MSDGITANYEGEWMYDRLDAQDKTQIKTFKTGRKIQALDEDEEVITDVDGNPVMIDEETIVLQRAAIWQLVRHRQFHGLTKNKPQNGEVEKVFSLVTGPKTSCTWSSIGRVGSETTWVCIHDATKVTNQITGSGIQRQVWVHIGQWQNVDGAKAFGVKSNWKLRNPSASNFNNPDGGLIPSKFL